MHQQNANEYIYEGNALFNNKSDRQLDLLKQVKKQLSKDNWLINKQAYKSQNWKRVFEFMIQCSVKQLFLQQHTHHFHILRNIQNVIFTNLKQLHLSKGFFQSDKNNIQNVQALSFMTFQNLQRLNLSNNNISQIKTFNKLSLKALQTIQLQKNWLSKINPLIRSKVNQRKLFDLSIQKQHFETNLIEDLSVLVKINSQCIQNLGVKSNKRMPSRRIQRMLKWRFRYINICKYQRQRFDQHRFY